MEQYFYVNGVIRKNNFSMAHLNNEPPLYIVQECAYISHWKKFIICGIVEKNQNFTLQKNNICSVKLEIYLLKKENFSALRAEDIFILSNSVL